MKKHMIKILLIIAILIIIFLVYMEIDALCFYMQTDLSVSGENFKSDSGDTFDYNDSIPSPTSEEVFESNSELLPHTTSIKTYDGSTYTNNLYLGKSQDYNEVAGITTFRGNNYRNSASYGRILSSPTTLEKKWTRTNGKTDNWTGVGWNGQPAIIKWDDDLKKQMNLYDEFKEKENFIEVIYGTLDSNIHFFDLETGASTRPSIHVPSSIKGSVTIDPRRLPTFICRSRN